MSPQNYFLLYECCIPVKGFTNSIICDLQRGVFKFIPDSLFTLLRNYKRRPVAEMFQEISDRDRDTVYEYLDYLVNNEFGFFTDTPDRFPDLDLTFETPSLVSNAIIDIDKTSEHSFRDLYSQLNSLGCNSVQLRFFESVEAEIIECSIMAMEGFYMSAEILLKHHVLDDQYYAALVSKYPQVVSLIVHSANENRMQQKGYNGMGSIRHVKEQINSASHCGEITPFQFSINLETFAEASSHNSCLNKKISVDTAGRVKSCPSMSFDYGNAKSIRLRDVIADKQFRTFWDITKDEVSICKDCEFRYICTDCRAFRVDETNLYSKPLKCQYDPYTGVWA